MPTQGPEKSKVFINSRRVFGLSFQYIKIMSEVPFDRSPGEEKDEDEGQDVGDEKILAEDEKMKTGQIMNLRLRPRNIA